MRKWIIIAALIIVPVALAQYNVQTLNSSPFMSLQTKHNYQTYFNITLVGNVISTAIDNAPAGARADFNLCQDATGGRTWVWPSTFQNTSTITVSTTALACTQASFITPDGTNWNNAGAGGGGGTSASVNAIGPVYNVTNSTYGAKGTGRICADAVSNSTTTVTSATCNFTSADNGSIAWVQNTGGTVFCGSARTTVTFVNATTITLSTTCGGSVNPGNLFIGPDDSVGEQAACAAVQTAGIGATIYHPAGRYLWGETAAPACSITSSLTGSVAFIGAGQGATRFDVAPWAFMNNAGFGDVINLFLNSLATEGDNAAFAYFEGFTLNGMKVTRAVSSQIIVYASQFSMRNVSIYNWNVTAGAGNQCVGGFGDSVNTFNSVWMVNCGGTAINALQPQTIITNSLIYGADAAVQCSSACSLEINGGIIQGTGTNGTGLFVTGTGGGTGITAAVHGAILCGSSPTKPAVLVNASVASTVWLDSVQINTGACGLSVSNDTGIQTAANNQVFITKSQITALGTGNTIINAGTIWQDLATVQNTSGGAGITSTGTNHHNESGVCTFAASTTCAVTFAETFGTATGLSVTITPINPGAVTFTINAAPVATGFTITASGSNSLSVGWSASL